MDGAKQSRRSLGTLVALRSDLEPNPPATPLDECGVAAVVDHSEQLHLVSEPPIELQTAVVGSASCVVARFALLRLGASQAVGVSLHEPFAQLLGHGPLSCTQFIDEFVAAESNRLLRVDVPAVHLKTGLNEGDGDLVDAVKDLPREWQPPASAREIGFVDNEIVRVKSERLLVKDAGVSQDEADVAFCKQRV